MKFKNIRCESMYTVWAVLQDDVIVHENEKFFLKYDELFKQYALKGNILAFIKFKNQFDEQIFQINLSRNFAVVAEIVSVLQKEILLNCIIFNGDFLEFDKIDIAVDSSLLKGKYANVPFGDLVPRLKEKTCFKVGSDAYFIMQAGGSISEDFADEIRDESISSVVHSHFCILGEQLALGIEKKFFGDSDEFLCLQKIITKTNAVYNKSIRLVHAEVFFSEYSKKAKLHSVAVSSLSKILEKEQSYLNTWDKFGEIEGLFLLRRARSIGIIKILEENGTLCIEDIPSGCRVFCQKVPESLNAGDLLEISNEIPPYLSNEEMTWSEYSQYLEEEYTEKKERQKKERAETFAGITKNETSLGENKPDLETDQESVIALVKNTESNFIELEIDKKSIFCGQMFWNINGEKIQIERQRNARKAILECTCANPQLGLIIEESGNPVLDSQKITRIPALSEYVKKKVFKTEPTSRQLEAIEIALNTPDIAVIQGPPGTGKTTVITAIIERLNELAKKDSSVAGTVLVTGYQHDAVDNIVSRVRVNDLPAIKFGGRSTFSGKDDTWSDFMIHSWCREVIDKIKAKNPEVSHTEEQECLFVKTMAYVKCPSDKNLKSLLMQLLNVEKINQNFELVQKINGILNSLTPDMGHVENQSLLQKIYRIRITENGFADDGVQNLKNVIGELEPYISDAEKEVLILAENWQKGQPLDFLKALAELKKRLLLYFCPIPYFCYSKVRDDVMRLIQQANTYLQSKLNDFDKKNLILANFLNELENNLFNVKKMLSDYNFVYAATTQQAEGKMIREAKLKKDKNNSVNRLVYDTVIVDEAARTSPRDLMIPMAQAERRIILVGDHKQLPHLINEEVARSLEFNQNLSEDEKRNIETSMFGYLFKRLKKLSQQDSIKRTITLDSQYRMHRLLGNFVSKNFYEKDGEGFDSPLSDENFKHNLAYTDGKPALWISVPSYRGAEQKEGHSRKRDVEAKIIADLLNTWMNSEEGQNLNFGVISFYKSQLLSVYKALAEHHIAEKQENYTIADNYRYNRKGQEFLRIGTVDSFQGMEFDVVILSVVRSRQISEEITDENIAALQRKYFGYLLSENRLCVSLSRQKKLLVVVGDNELVNSELAKDSAIAVLGKFYELCQNEGTVL